MPFDFRLFFRMFRLAFAERMSPRRRKVVWFLAIVWPLHAALSAVCLVFDHVLFPGFRRVEVREPVFIVGHSRSGTSLLHKLMCADGERFSWFMTYELLLPSLVQKRLVRWLARMDRRFLDSAVERRVTAWEDRVFAKGRKMHPMSLTGPEEDEFTLALPFCSASVAMVFPYLSELQPWNCFDRMLPERKRRRILGYYRELVRRQLFLNGPEKAHLAKNPVFSDKVESLLETFPRARFVVMVRNPLETIPSIQKMMERNWKASDCDPQRVRDSLKVLFENSISAYRHPFAVLESRTGVPWTVVRYEDLVEEPRATVERVYGDLGLPVTGLLRASLAREEERSREYRAEHLYSLEEYGLTGEEIRTELSSLFERFAWKENADDASAHA